MSLGERVRVLRADGSAAFARAFFLSHADPAAVGPFIEARTVSGAALAATPDHLAIVEAADHDALAEPLHTRTKAFTQLAAAGDALLVLGSNGMLVRASRCLDGPLFADMTDTALQSRVTFLLHSA